MSLKGIPKNTDVTSLIVELVKLLKPHTYVELGVKWGYTFNQIAPLVSRAVAVDQAGCRGIIRRSNVELSDFSTDDFAKLWAEQGDPIDFLFIDACHEKEQVLKDFNNFFRYVTPGTGIICLHDTYPIKKELAVEGYCGSAWEAAKEIRNNSLYNRHCEIVTIPGPWFGMSIIRKIEANKHFGWTR
jgi:hypothetical protein